MTSERRNRTFALACALGFAAIALGLLAQPYLGALRTWGLARTWDGIYGSTMYSRVVVSVDYFTDGFIRRGLSGTLAALVSGHDPKGVLAFWLASIAAFVVPLALIVRRLAARTEPRVALYFAAILLASPQTFVGWARDPVRTDLLAAGFVAWSVVALLGDRRWLAVACILAGLLVHEVALLFGAPLLVACALVSSGKRPPADRWAPAAALVVGAGALLLVQAVSSAPAGDVAARMLSAFPSSDENRIWRDIAIYMAVGGSHALQTAMCHNFVLNPKWPITTVLCLALLCVYAFVLPLRRRRLAFAVAALLPVLFMLVIANDVGRWLKLGVLNAWLLAAFVHLRAAEPEPLRTAFVVRGVVLLALLAAMGWTPHSDINVATRHLIVRLGFVYDKTGEQWLDTCDPDWRSVVYGP